MATLRDNRKRRWVTENLEHALSIIFPAQPSADAVRTARVAARTAPVCCAAVVETPGTSCKAPACVNSPAGKQKPWAMDQTASAARYNSSAMLKGGFARRSGGTCSNVEAGNRVSSSQQNNVRRAISAAAAEPDAKVTDVGMFGAANAAKIRSLFVRGGRSAAKPKVQASSSPAPLPKRKSGCVRGTNGQRKELKARCCRYSRPLRSAAPRAQVWGISAP